LWYTPTHSQLILPAIYSLAKLSLKINGVKSGICQFLTMLKGVLLNSGPDPIFPYLNYGHTLREIADHLNLNPNYLSFMLGKMKKI
jgi:hypothetical protein